MPKKTVAIDVQTPYLYNHRYLLKHYSIPAVDQYPGEATCITLPCHPAVEVFSEAVPLVLV